MSKQKPLKAAKLVSWFQCHQGWAVIHATKPPLNPVQRLRQALQQGLRLWAQPPSLQSLSCKADANWFSTGQTGTASACPEPVETEFAQLPQVP